METGETILSEEYRSVYSPGALRFGDRRIVSRVTLPDSVDVVRHQKKNFWRAGAETVGFNIGLWAFDRYVLKVPLRLYLVEHDKGELQTWL